ncbi:hypothetical protein B296_00004694 [Ensete ventricosum]|uniref:Uncharacterized protein n=1 Tax=Ensete ventricosum TaxID=4639 RepID=A0A427B826_ENSVE|nr:hypothetical protein B296_00004694 [Ensete ventricosum]
MIGGGLLKIHPSELKLPCKSFCSFLTRYDWFSFSLSSPINRKLDSSTAKRFDLDRVCGSSFSCVVLVILLIVGLVFFAVSRSFKEASTGQSHEVSVSIKMGTSKDVPLYLIINSVAKFRNYMKFGTRELIRPSRGSRNLGDLAERANSGTNLDDLVERVNSGTNLGDLAEKVNSGTNLGDLAERANSGTNLGDLTERVNSGINLGDLTERANSGTNLGDLTERVNLGTNLGYLVEKMNLGTNLGELAERANSGINLGDLTERVNSGTNLGDLAKRMNSCTNLDDLAEKVNSGTNLEDLAERANSGTNLGNLIEKVNSGTNLGDLAEKVNSGTNLRDLAERANSGTNLGDLAEKVNSGTNLGDLAKRVNLGTNLGDLTEKVNSGTNLRDLAERANSGTNLGDLAERANPSTNLGGEPEASSSGASSGPSSPVDARVLRDLEVMKAGHDLDTAVTEGSLTAIRERYSIPTEYRLYVPQPEQCPYSSDVPGVWENLRNSSKVWRDHAIAEEFERGLLHPQLARELYTLPSEVLLARATKEMVLMTLFDRVHDASRLITFVDYRINNLLEEIKTLKAGDGPEAVAAAEERVAKLEKCTKALQRLETSDKELNEVRGDLSEAHKQLKEAQVRARKANDDLLKSVKDLDSTRAELLKRAIDDYKESTGFKEGLKRMGRVAYEYGYRVALARFRSSHPDSEVEEDPFTVRPKDDLVPMERQHAFDDSDLPES